MAGDRDGPARGAARAAAPGAADDRTAALTPSALQSRSPRFVGATVASRGAMPEHPGRAWQERAHPLDPLSADEIRQAAAILRRDQGVGERWRFASIELREPSKEAVRDFAPATRSRARRS